MKRTGIIAAGAACAFAAACSGPELPNQLAHSMPSTGASSPGPEASDSSPKIRPTPSATSNALSRVVIRKLFDQQLRTAQDIAPATTATLTYLQGDETVHCSFGGRGGTISAKQGNANLFCTDQDQLVIDEPFVSSIAKTEYPQETFRIFMAHELGHAIQKAAGVNLATTLDSGQKLLGEKQADCYSAQIIRESSDFTAEVALKAAENLYALSNTSDPENQTSADERLAIFAAGLEPNASCDALSIP